MNKVFMMIIGKPNSGKGTLSIALKQLADILVISVGEFCREEKEKNSEYWKRAQKTMEDTGNTLWPDDVLMEALINKLSTCPPKGHLALDAFPNSLAQVDGVLRIFQDLSFTRVVSVHIDLDDAGCIERARARKRHDDEKIHDRLKDYREHSLPAHLELNDRLRRVINPALVKHINISGRNMKKHAPLRVDAIIRACKLPRKDH